MTGTALGGGIGDAELTPDLETLRRRARELAREVDELRAEESIEVVQFSLGGETYAIETQYVREAYPLRDVTSMPGAPNWIRGVVNVRSQVLAVVDLRPFLHLGKNPFADTGRLLILQGPLGTFALLVDSISGVRLLDLEEIQTPGPGEPGVRVEYLRGVTAERLIVLYGNRLMEDRRLAVGE